MKILSQTQAEKEIAYGDQFSRTTHRIRRSPEAGLFVLVRHIVHADGVTVWDLGHLTFCNAVALLKDGKAIDETSILFSREGANAAS